MVTLDSLPPDQRAVLALVLQRNHSFDDIAELLSIDRAAVRDRALTALDALGPETEVDAGHRALITDYLLGQLPPRVAENVRHGLASSAPQRAWARVIASDLAPLSSRSLPEIPSGSSDSGPVRAAEAQDAAAASTTSEKPASRGTSKRTPEPAAAAAEGRAAPPSRREPGGGERPSSRVGGAILLGIGLLIAIVAVIVIIANSGGSGNQSSTQASASTSTAASTTSAGSATSGTSKPSSAKPIAQVNLTSPTGNAKIGGVAIVVRQGATEGLVIRAQGVPANNGHDAYAVWLYNGPGDQRILGFVNPGVTATRVLQTAGPLPANAAHFKQLLVTREAQAKPTGPGTIVLQGALSLTG